MSIPINRYENDDCPKKSPIAYRLTLIGLYALSKNYKSLRFFRTFFVTIYRYRLYFDITLNSCSYSLKPFI